MVMVVLGDGDGHGHSPCHLDGGGDSDQGSPGVEEPSRGEPSPPGRVLRGLGLSLGPGLSLRPLQRPLHWGLRIWGKLQGLM